MFNMYYPQTLLKVNGYEGAKNYQPMPPNSQIALFDSNEDIFYIKQSDAGGFSSVSAYKFTPYNPKAEYEASGALKDYVTREEFNKLKEIIENVELAISESKPAEHNQPTQPISADYARERPKRNS